MLKWSFKWFFSEKILLYLSKKIENKRELRYTFGIYF